MISSLPFRFYYNTTEAKVKGFEEYNYLQFPLIYQKFTAKIEPERHTEPRGTVLWLDKYRFRRKIMANKSAKKALEQFKMQAASEVGVNLKNGYNGELTARQAGSIGGQMVKKMVESYENSLKTNG